MSSMWNLELNEVVASTSPVDIVEEQCEYLRKHTDGKIIAKISGYYEPISSYTRYGFGSLLRSALQSGGDTKVDIQEDLGDIGNTYFTYEFFITSIATPNYKFRVMFMRHDITGYPIELVMDADIAHDMSFIYSNNSQNFVCENERVFKEVLEEILNSTKVAKVINALYSTALREEQNEPLPPLVSEDS